MDSIRMTPNILLLRKADGSWLAGRETYDIWANGSTRQEALYNLFKTHSEQLGIEITIVEDPNHQVVVRRTSGTDPIGNYFSGFAEGPGRQPLWEAEGKAQEMTLQHAIEVVKTFQYARPKIENAK